MARVRPGRISRFIADMRVEPGRKVRLPRDFDPSKTTRGVSRSEAKAILGQGIEYLAEYQARLAAQDDYAVLVCLQAMDAAGKDGAICHMMSGVNPQGVEVHSFKVPSSENLDHDYQWRYQKRLPERGHIGFSTAPTTRRCWSSGSIPRSSRARRSRRSSRTAGSGSGATARSTTGSTT